MLLCTDWNADDDGDFLSIQLRTSYERQRKEKEKE